MTCTLNYINRTFHYIGKCLILEKYVPTPTIDIYVNIEHFDNIINVIKS